MVTENFRVAITEGDYLDGNVGDIRHLRFTRVVDAHMSITSTERLTMGQLRATRDAISEFLGEGNGGD